MRIDVDELFRDLTIKLPEDWTLQIEVLEGTVTVSLTNPKGESVAFNRSGKVSDQIGNALAMAMGANP